MSDIMTIVSGPKGSSLTEAFITELERNGLREVSANSIWTSKESVRKTDGIVDLLRIRCAPDKNQLAKVIHCLKTVVNQFTDQDEGYFWLRLNGTRSLSLSTKSIEEELLALSRLHISEESKRGIEKELELEVIKHCGGLGLTAFRKQIHKEPNAALIEVARDIIKRKGKLKQLRDIDFAF